MTAGLRARPRFREDDHPRDRRGRFVEVGGTVVIRGGGVGTVLATVGGGRIRVRREDGHEVVIDAGLVTQTRTAAQNVVAPTPRPITAERGANAPTRDELREHLYDGLTIDNPEWIKRHWSAEHQELMRSVQETVDDLVARMAGAPESAWDGPDRGAKVYAALELWVETSNGKNPTALARQETAAELFGLDDVMDWTMTPELRAEVDATRERNRAFDEAFLTAQYEATQAWFRGRGITEVELFRGFAFQGDGPAWVATDGMTTDLKLRPISSFTSDETRANSFSLLRFSDTAAVISGTVPVERIFSTPRTGIGELGEDEFIVLGGPAEWKVRRRVEGDTPPPPPPPEPVDPATLGASELTSSALLAGAIAAADTDERRAAIAAQARNIGLGFMVPDGWAPPPVQVPLGEQVDPELITDREGLKEAFTVAIDSDAPPERIVALIDRARALGMPWAVPYEVNMNGTLKGAKSAAPRLSVQAHAGRLVLLPEVKAGRLGTPNFEENEHPRDRLGRFVEVGGTVSIRGGGQGTVLETVGGGRVKVRRDDGREVVVDAGLTTQIRTAAQNERRAGGGAGLDQALADNPDALPPPGDRPEEQAQTDPQLAAARPVGAAAAPDADPAGAMAYLSSPDGAQVAWLRNDEGDTPVGYLRPDAADTASTLRYDDGQAWARDVDAAGMAETAEAPAAPDVTPQDAPQTAEDETQAAPGGVPDDAAADVAAGAAGATRALRSPTTVSPENLRAFLDEGLTDVATFREAGGDASDKPDGAVISKHDEAAVQAKIEVAANITARMAEIPDDDVLREDDRARIDRIESGQVVLARVPYHVAHPAAREKLPRTPGSPTPGEELANWEYREVPAARYEQLRGGPVPEGFELVTADQWRAWKRDERVSNAVALWAQTSNGTNAHALAMQETAADLFGMEEHADWAAYEDFPELRGQVDDVLATDRPFNEAFLLAQYEATQDAFAAQGITEVELFRGFRTYGETPEWATGDTTDQLRLRPMSSFSSDEGIAGSFARSTDGSDGIVVSTVVPVERILSTPRSGSGSLSEAEFVVLAGPGDYNVRQADERDGPPLDTDWEPIAELADDEFYDDTPEEPFDPANTSAGLIGSEEDLLAAIAAASDPARRQALMNRARSMGLAGLIPESWQANGEVAELPDTAERGADGQLVPLTDEQLAEHTTAVETAIGRALAAGLATDKQFSLDGRGEVWSPERAKQHNEIVDAVWATAVNVPNEGRGLFSGGMGGAGKTTTLGNPQTGIDQSQYLTINPDDIKEIMAARGMIPDIPDSDVELSPMEKVSLIHEESSYIAQLLAERAYAERKNVTWDITMASAGSVQKRMAKMQDRGYGELKAVFVDIPVEGSVSRAMSRYTRGLEKYRNGDGQGGRYVPPSVIRANASTSFSSANRANFESLRDQFDDWQVWDNSVDGRDPRLVYYKGAPELDRLTEIAREGLTDAELGTDGKALRRPRLRSSNGKRGWR